MRLNTDGLIDVSVKTELHDNRIDKETVFNLHK